MEEIVKEIPVKEIHREHLLETLQTTNMLRAENETLLKLTPLVYTTIEEWEEELGEETGKSFTCERCGKVEKTKSTLGKHVKSSYHCNIWYETKKNCN